MGEVGGERQVFFANADLDAGKSGFSDFDLAAAKLADDFLCQLLPFLIGLFSGGHQLVQFLDCVDDKGTSRRERLLDQRFDAFGLDFAQTQGAQEAQYVNIAIIDRLF